MPRLLYAMTGHMQRICRTFIDFFMAPSRCQNDFNIASLGLGRSTFCIRRDAPLSAHMQILCTVVANSVCLFNGLGL